MRFFDVGEQPELIGKDLEQIVAAAFGCAELTEVPRIYSISNIESETRLKFNAPTPVAAMDLSFISGRFRWELQLLYWEVDGEWEVVQAVKSAAPF